ncbi:MAG: hypothetical protein F4103_05025, partial [Boseongicola sp. SB0673_bin_14]|nr:hypothetical protein [Boseongicola sp. SB0673_bin_14]
MLEQGRIHAMLQQAAGPTNANPYWLNRIRMNPALKCFLGAVTLLCSMAIVFYSLLALYLVEPLTSISESVFGKVRGSDVSTVFPIAILISVWVLIAVIQFVPSWRSDFEASLPKWPSRERPYLSFLIFGIVVCVACVFVSFAIGHLYEYFEVSSNFREVSFPFVLLVYNLILLYPLRGAFLDIPISAGAGVRQPKFSRSLPATIRTRQLGQPELRLALARDLRARSGQLRRFSYFALFCIFCMLVVAVLVIVFAGTIASLDIGQSNIERAKAIVQAEQSIASRLRRSIAENERELDRRGKPFAGFLGGESGPGQGDPDFADFDVESQAILDERNELEKQLERQVTTVATVENAFRSVLEDAVKASPGGGVDIENTNLLIASGITRFGILIVVTFVLHLLYNLNRYT